MKQETLEEFSLNYSNFGSQQLDFLNGAKWQQENFIISSKIDDVIELIETNGNSINDKNLTINDIYELCKKLQHLQIKQKSVADVFKQGAKWQQERSYSEEEVIELLQKALIHQDDGETGSLVTTQGKIRIANFYSWFEQFKKK